MTAEISFGGSGAALGIKPTALSADEPLSLWSIAPIDPVKAGKYFDELIIGEQSLFVKKKSLFHQILP